MSLHMMTNHAIKIIRWGFTSVFAGSLVAACASTGTEPHAMTAGQHQAAAESEEQAAASHQGQHDPSAKTRPPPGPSMGAYSACISYENSNCYVRWQSEENPTDKHRKQAEQHKKLAEKHRAASKAVVDAEQRFCSGIPEADRDLSPFAHREDIIAVQGRKKPDANYAYSGTEGVLEIPIEQAEKANPGSLQGARVTFRAVSGMTGEWLQRVVNCHLARNAVVGGGDMPYCPLAVRHATAIVTSTGGGFAVDIISDNADSVREIVRRAAALRASAPVAVK